MLRQNIISKFVLICKKGLNKWIILNKFIWVNLISSNVSQNNVPIKQSVHTVSLLIPKKSANGVQFKRHWLDTASAGENIYYCGNCNAVFSIFFRATEQAQTYLKIWVLVSHWTYTYPSLFECAENTSYHIFAIFKL